MIRVTVTKDGDEVLALSLAKEDIIIGRGHEADVQLTSEAVSRRHARLQRVDGSWQIADLGAANGVYVSSPKKEPERIVIRPLKPGDRIHIEAFIIRVEEVEGVVIDKNDFAQDDDPDETTLETNRTQFISMVDVLAARRGIDDDDEPPTVSGPIMRVVSDVGGRPTIEKRATGSFPQASFAKPAAAAAAAPPKVVETAGAWYAKMTSASGHERNFTLSGDKVQVGSGDSCQVRLPTGPGVIVELERAGENVAFRRVPLWPFPRVVVGGRAERSGYLADGESFLVGEYEVTVHVRRAQ